jgi:hypothetical protein
VDLASDSRQGVGVNAAVGPDVDRRAAGAELGKQQQLRLAACRFLGDQLGVIRLGLLCPWLLYLGHPRPPYPPRFPCAAIAYLARPWRRLVIGLFRRLEDRVALAADAAPMARSAAARAWHLPAERVHA